MMHSGTSLALKQDLAVADTEAQKAGVWKDPRPGVKVRLFNDHEEEGCEAISLIEIADLDQMIPSPCQDSGSEKDARRRQWSVKVS